jgi:ATP-dependent exoDNAse (exonuclease V) beta subunit
MTFVPVDAGVREEIATELGESLCVEAGAGTGKTTVLVRRIVELLASGRCSVDGLAAITFTEAAAAELAARVREALEAALDDATDPARREAAGAALTGLHRARIETIHAFAAALLRERPVEAGLDPGFEVLDDLAARLSFDEAYDRWRGELLQGDHAELVRCLNRGFGLPELRRLVDAVHRHRYLLPFEPWHAPPADLDGFRSVLREQAAELARLLPLAQGDDRARSQIEEILDFAERVRAAGEDEAWLERVLLFDAPGIDSDAGNQSRWEDKQDCKDAKACFRALADALADAQTALRTEALAGAFPLAEAFVRAFEAERRAAGKADFDDLLVWARDLLVRSPEALAAFRRRFQAILVDEFQDTDPLQAEIALLLAGEGGPTRPLALVPGPGRLVVVGDPKQSIYRFRRADIAVYDAVKRGPLDGCVRQLRQNFRSLPAVLRFVNDVFDRVLVEELGRQPGNVPLEPVPGEDVPLGVVVVEGVSQGKTEESRREEARLVAATIRTALDEGWPVRDRADGALRPLRPDDVVCLYRARTGSARLEEALAAQAIPYRVEGGRTFFRRQEVRDLGHLLRAIDDPTDELSVFGALRSAAFSCTDEEAYLWKLGGGRFDYRRRQEGDGPVAEALAVLRDLHDLRARVSLGELVREAITRTRLVESALGAPAGAQAAANLVKLAERARAFSSAGGGGVRDFARWLSESEASEAQEAEAGIADERDEVVRLMTIHAAKGLEFPVVVLCGLWARAPSDSGPIPDRGGNRLHVRISVGSQRRRAAFETPGYELAQQDEQAHGEAELRRLLYVATTRARDRLVIPVLRDPRGADGPLLAALLPSLGEGAQGVERLDPAALPSAPELEDAEPEHAGPEEVEAALVERERWAAERAAVLRGASREVAIVPATARDGPEPHVALLAADDAPLILGEGPPREIGEVVHRVLELCDLGDPSSVGPLAAAVCAVAGIPECEGEVAEVARACLASPVVGRALASGAVWREVPYTVAFADGYRTGRVDLVFREGGALVAVDWKTDAVGPAGVAGAVEEHRAQVEAYRDALAEATGLPVGETVLVFPRAREERAIP